MASEELFRIAAFTDNPDGGNPAGVWLGESLPTREEMQRIAAAVGFSETVFVENAVGNRRKVRYFSPEAEVPFCGHATIAAGAVLRPDDGSTTYEFDTQAGIVRVAVTVGGEHTRIALTSVETRYRYPDDSVVDEFLTTLRWHASELDSAVRPAFAFAGAWHLVLAVSSSARLGELDYDFDSLRSLMTQHDLTTLQLIWRESPGIVHARNPFPVGGVVEDPATGAAAAALGGYFRDAGLITPAFSFTIHQGETMGRPSTIVVDVPATGGITVSGTAVQMRSPD